MTRLYCLEPEVAGGWGRRTTVTNREDIARGRAKVPEVAYLEYEFQGWLGDELLESFPCFIISEDLVNDLKAEAVNGLRTEPVLVSVSPQFREILGDQQLPRFVRLIPEGRVRLGSDGSVAFWSGHDLCTTESADLVVTRRCLEILLRHPISHNQVRELAEVPDVD